MNLPNRISIARICLIPLVVAFFLLGAFDIMSYANLIAFLIFTFAACTDFVDGMIARKRNIVTDFGKFADSIADKCLLLAGLVLITAVPFVSASSVMFLSSNVFGIIGLIGMIIILSRELIISAFRQIAATKNVVMMADKQGKIKAIIQDITVAGYFLLASLVQDYKLSGLAFDIINYFLFALYCISIVLTITSGVNYVVKNKKVLQEVEK